MIRLKEPRLLTDDELTAYRNDGFVVVENLIKAAEVAGLQARLLFFFNDAAPTEIYTLSLDDALPIWTIPSIPF
mgnify:CR=1 FL=1